MVVLKRKLKEYEVEVDVNPEDKRILQYVAEVRCPLKDCKKIYTAKGNTMGRAATKVIDTTRVHIKKSHEK